LQAQSPPLAPRPQPNAEGCARNWAARLFAGTAPPSVSSTARRDPHCFPPACRQGLSGHVPSLGLSTVLPVISMSLLTVLPTQPSAVSPPHPLHASPAQDCPVGLVGRCSALHNLHQACVLQLAVSLATAPSRAVVICVLGLQPLQAPTERSNLCPHKMKHWVFSLRASCLEALE